MPHQETNTKLINRLYKHRLVHKQLKRERATKKEIPDTQEIPFSQLCWKERLGITCMSMSKISKLLVIKTEVKDTQKNKIQKKIFHVK